MPAQVLPFTKDMCLLCVDLNLPGEFQKALGLPGFRAIVDGTRNIRFRTTPNNMRYIGENWPDIIWHPDCQHFIDQFIKDQIAANELSSKKKEILEDDGSYLYKTEPMDHQRQLFLMSRDKAAFASLMEQGTGKTKPDIDTTAYLYSQGLIDAFVLIAPNGVHTNWCEEEIPKHFPDWCPKDEWVYSSNLTKKRLKKLEEVCASTGSLKIFYFNIEAFQSSDKARKLLKRILASFRCKVTIDESQFIKNHSAERTKFLTKACEFAPYKRILTGTSITKGVQDIYSQFSWLNKNILGFDSFYTFRNHFCRMGGFEMKQIIGYKNIDELTELISPYSFRVTKDECLGLPPKVYKRHWVELTKEQRKIYDKLSKDFYAELAGHGTVSAPLAITRMLRLQQVTCGWFPSGEDYDLVRIPGGNPKLEAAIQHVSDYETPSLIWARFIQDVDEIAKELRIVHGKDAIGVYKGGLSNDEKTKLVRDFQAGNLKAMVCSKAAARGLTLTACENPFYHSQDYDLEFRQQSEDRCHRRGTVNSVLYTDCVARKTNDLRVIKSLINKRSIADLVNQDGPSLFLLEMEDV